MNRDFFANPIRNHRIVVGVRVYNIINYCRMKATAL